MAKLKQHSMCEVDFSTEQTETSGQLETALLDISTIPEMMCGTFILVK